jgi:predicted CXXCH cytochrome family protein
MKRLWAIRMTSALGLALPALGGGLLGASGCAQLEQERLARIEIGGSHTLAVGQTLTLVPMTIDGRDAAYDFASLAPEVATVTEQGLVRGVAPGEASIVVTGRETRVRAEHPIVVTSLPLTDGGGPTGVPFFAEWQGSAHADVTAEAFTHWDEDGEVPTACARCHTQGGFRDFLGDDGSAPGRVDQPAPLGSTVGCETCHNPAANSLSDVTFPSGFELTGLGGEARCMTCHQGRSSGLAVQQAIDDAALSGDDEVSDALGFLNIHYYPAASTLLAGQANGGYQYAERVYDTRFRHVEAFDTCTECHDPHSTRPRFNECVTCHAGASDLAGAHDIRMPSSSGRDYDGDGDVSEGIYQELSGLSEQLLITVQRYGAERNAPLCYAEATHPYWFSDTDADGQCASTEAVSDNAFAAWTARLVKATYNYQMATKDPGAFAHNAKYILELLYDSIEDLNLGLTVKVDVSATVRGDRGHFDGSSEAARHWDADEAVDASCSRCHGGQQGFRFFVEHGTSIEVPETANGLECGTCHTSFGNEFAVLEVASTTFPSGIELQQPGFDNLCGVCHSGRASKATLDAQIATEQFRFVNVHYLPAAGTKLGAEAAIGYEYEGRVYAAALTHMGGAQCTSCHDPIMSQHSFTIADTWDSRCNVCHADANGNPENVRLVHLADYDGDADVSESLRAEVDGMAAALLVAMRNAAGASGLCYEPSTYPYFFGDPNGDGVCSVNEAISANAFTAWTAALMRAAHNFQLSRKDPGAWAHNFDYIGQLLFDSTENLALSGGVLTRP